MVNQRRNLLAKLSLKQPLLRRSIIYLVIKTAMASQTKGSWFIITAASGTSNPSLVTFKYIATTTLAAGYLHSTCCQSGEIWWADILSASEIFVDSGWAGVLEHAAMAEPWTAQSSGMLRTWINIQGMDWHSGCSVTKVLDATTSQCLTLAEWNKRRKMPMEQWNGVVINDNFDGISGVKIIITANVLISLNNKSVSGCIEQQVWNNHQ